MKTMSTILVAAALFSGLAYSGQAAVEDKITLSTSGETISGVIENYDRTKKVIMFATDKAKIPYPIASLKEYTLAVRPEADNASALMAKGELDKAATILKPIVDKYLGLNANWIAEAAGDLAECYTRQRNAVEADTIFKLIRELYPKSPLRLKGDFVQARTFIERNVPEEAIKVLDQVETELPKSPNLNATYTAMYSELNFIRGNAYEKMGKHKEAYEAYLKTAIIFIQPEDRAKEALAKAQEIKKTNPEVFVN